MLFWVTYLKLILKIHARNEKLFEHKKSCEKGIIKDAIIYLVYSHRGNKLFLIKCKSDLFVQSVFIENGGGWKNPLDVIWSNPPAQAGSPKACCPEPCSEGFWVCISMETPQPHWATCACAHPHSKTVFPDVQREPLVSACVHCPLTCGWAQMGGICLHLLSNVSPDICVNG